MIMTFAERLKQLRTSRGYSQRKLSEALGMAQSRIGNYEAGLREPDFETLEQIADFFNVPLSSLIASEYGADRELVKRVADSLHKNPKLGLLFDRTCYMDETDLDAVLAVVNAITREREPE